MKAHSQLDHSSYSSLKREPDRSAARRIDPSDDLEKRALARTIASDKTKGFTRTYVQTDVLQGPERLPDFPVPLVKGSDYLGFQGLRFVVADGKRLGDIYDLYRCLQPSKPLLQTEISRR